MSLHTNRSSRKSNSKKGVIVSDQVISREKHPFFEKKLTDARAVLKTASLPKSLLKGKHK